MDRGNVVFVSCFFKLGGFPNERVFIIRSDGYDELRGIVDASYCFDTAGLPLAEEPSPGEEISGRLVGIVVRDSENIIRVHLPDGEVYGLLRTNVMPTREGSPRHVPV